MRRKKASVYAFSEDDIPPSDDPRWQEWATVVSARLATPKTSLQLLDDCPEYSYALLMNILAWMDIRKLVGKQREGKILRWFAVEPPKPVEIPPVCLCCGGKWTVRQAGLVCVMCGRTPEEVMA